MAVTYREVRVETGGFMRVCIFPVRPVANARKKKNKPTAATQERMNRINAARRLSDIINLNFTKSDVQLKLDYSAFRSEHGRNPDADEVARIMSNFLRRLKRAYLKKGIELKYVYCTEQGTRGHLTHHHVIVSAGLSLDEIRSLWRDGGVWMRKLYFDERGCFDLAGYFVKAKYTYRSYTSSRNCIRPQESGRDKCIYKNDYRINQKTFSKITSNDATAIRRLYPDWELAELPDLQQIIDYDTGEVQDPMISPFLCLWLYKPWAVSEKNEKWRSAKNEKSQTA